VESEIPLKSFYRILCDCDLQALLFWIFQGTSRKCLMISVVPEFSTSIRIKPLFACSLIKKYVWVILDFVCWFLTSQRKLPEEIFLSSCANFSAKRNRLRNPARTTSFHSQMSRRFGKQFFLFYAQFLDLLGWYFLLIMI
jgi:hypothetical protein